MFKVEGPGFGFTAEGGTKATTLKPKASNSSPFHHTLRRIDSINPSERARGKDGSGHRSLIVATWLVYSGL